MHIYFEHVCELQTHTTAIVHNSALGVVEKKKKCLPMSVRIRRTKGPASPRPGSMAPCRPSLCSQLKVPWDSALKTVLPQLSVPQSANAAPDLPGLNLSTRPPPQTLAAVQQSGDGRGIEKRKERLQQQKKRKER